MENELGIVSHGFQLDDQFTNKPLCGCQLLESHIVSTQLDPGSQNLFIYLPLHDILSLPSKQEVD